jgi:hypothetical protein
MRIPLIVLGVLSVFLTLVYAITFYVVRSGTGRVELRHIIMDQKGNSNPFSGSPIERGAQFGWEATVRSAKSVPWTAELTAPAARKVWDKADLVSVSEDHRVGRYSGNFKLVRSSSPSDLSSFLDLICFVNRYTAKQIWPLAADEPFGEYSLTVSSQGTRLTLTFHLDESGPR